MNKKNFVRKCEKYTVWEASDPVVVDIELLRKCKPPFDGETEQDLLDFLNDNVFCNDDFFNNESNIKIYGSEQLYQLSLEECYHMKVYSDSRNNEQNHWIDVGIPNEDFSKMGGFEVKATNFS
tara:strand:- start:243 stop:611 length:369 start_codon:yes stop_codon:yes gene_type:complete